MHVSISIYAVYKRMTYLGMIAVVLFGRPFVKRFALCYRTVVCPVLSVCPPVCNVLALAKRLDGSR